MYYIRFVVRPAKFILGSLVSHMGGGGVAHRLSCISVFANENLPTVAKMACIEFSNAGHLSSTQAILGAYIETQIMF